MWFAGLMGASRYVLEHRVTRNPQEERRPHSTDPQARNKDVSTEGRTKERRLCRPNGLISDPHQGGRSLLYPAGTQNSITRQSIRSIPPLAAGHSPQKDPERTNTTAIASVGSYQQHLTVLWILTLLCIDITSGFLVPSGLHWGLHLACLEPL